MKTILVVYTNVELSTIELNKRKHYAFNTKAELEVGDSIKSPTYDTKMVVVRTLEESFKYYNMATGELSNNFTSTAQRPIRDLVIQEDSDQQVVYATKVK